MAKIRIVEGSPITITFVKDDGTEVVLHAGDLTKTHKKFRVEHLTEREVEISIGKA